jgi:rhodanese-related sulfurtransferase
MKYIIYLISLLIITLVVYIIVNSSGKRNTITNQSSEEMIVQISEAKGDSTENDLPIIKSVGVKEAKEIIATKSKVGNFRVIDIRTPGEYEDGHIGGAEILNFYDSNFTESVKNLDKSVAYLIYCRSGNRSSSALKIFDYSDFKEVYELVGGYVAWLSYN